MDPVSIGLGLAGLGMQLFGGFKQAEVSKQTAQVSAGIAADEQQVQVQKQQQMQLEADRTNLQNFRRTQQVKAQGLATATAGGAQFGSGIAGAQASETSEGLYNSLGINQNLEIGKNIFGINSDISGKKIKLAQLGGEAATDQGISSMGGAIMKSGPTVGAFTKSVFKY